MPQPREATRTSRKIFWCPYARRMVAVEFAEAGPALFRRQTAIRDCSAFEHPSRISCPRECLDPAFRRESGPARWDSEASGLW